MKLAPFAVPYLEELGPGKEKMGVELEGKTGVEIENPNMTEVQKEKEERKQNPDFP